MLNAFSPLELVDFDSHSDSSRSNSLSYQGAASLTLKHTKRIERLTLLFLSTLKYSCHTLKLLRFYHCYILLWSIPLSFNLLLFSLPPPYLRLTTNFHFLTLNFHSSTPCVFLLCVHSQSSPLFKPGPLLLQVTACVTHYLCVKCGELSMKVVWRAGMAMVWWPSCNQLRSESKLGLKKGKREVLASI